MTHKLTAARDLTVDGRQIPKGTPVGELVTDLPVDRLLAGLSNGNVDLTTPEPEVTTPARG